MIDVHTHILPGIDDGANDKEESFCLIEMLKKQGVTGIICTPHFNAATSSMADFIENRKKAFQSLSDTDIKLIKASETYYHDYLFHYNDLTPLCIEKTNYLLLELPLDKKDISEYIKGIERLYYYYNVIPIIAHVERYKYIARSKRSLEYLKNLGCLFQMNTETIINNKKCKRLVQFLLNNDYIDLLGTDCHNIGNRAPVIDKVKEEITSIYGIEMWNKFMENSYKIINEY